MVKQPRKGPDERHKDVKAVARKLFQKKGYENVTTTEIAEGAGLSRALIYRYNISKTDLLAELLRDLVEEQATALARVRLKESSPIDMVVTYFERLFQLDVEEISLRRLAVQQSWNWDERTEEDFYLRMGAIFEPLVQGLDRKWSIELHEPARIALWAIYTEALRVALVRTSSASDLAEQWRIAFVPSATLIVRGLKR